MRSYRADDGRLERPFGRLIWLLVTMAPACALAVGYVARLVASQNLAPPMASLGGPTAMVVLAVALFGVLYHTRGAWHLATWALTTGLAAGAWVKGIAPAFVQWVVASAGDPAALPGGPTGLVATTLANAAGWRAGINRGVIGDLLLVTLIWFGLVLNYLNSRLLGRRLPIYYDTWLGMRVKSRPGDDQTVAVVVYPSVLLFDRIDGRAFSQAGRRVPLRETPVPGFSARVAARSEIPVSAPVGQWLKVPAAAGGDLAWVYSWSDAPLSYGKGPTARPESVLGKSFEGFWSEPAAAPIDEVRELVLVDRKVSLPVALKVPDRSGTLELELELSQAQGESIPKLRMRALRLSHVELTPLDASGEPPALTLEEVAAAWIILVIRIPETVKPNPPLLEQAMKTLADRVAVPLAGLELQFAPPGGSATRQMLITGGTGRRATWLKDEAADGPIRQFVLSGHEWLARPDAPLPPSLGLDARTGALICLQGELKGYTLLECSDAYLVSGPDGQVRWVLGHGPTTRAVLKAAERVLGSRLA